MNESRVEPIGSKPSEEIRAIRKSLGLTQSEFAGRIGVILRSVQRWEAGDRRPSGTVMILARRLSRR